MVTREPPGLASLLGLGTVTALLLVIGFGLGWFVDRLLHTFPIFAFIGLALGIAGAGRYTYLKIRQIFFDD
jgi:F0F1-type ATP synthase assembly protein I